jgi:SRSO17 transposase
VTFLKGAGLPSPSEVRSISYILPIELTESPPLLALTPAEISALAEELQAYHAEFAALFYRVEQAQWCLKYLQGLLLQTLPRKAIPPMALALEGGNVQAMQHFIGQGQWQDDAVLQRHWELVNATLGEDDAVLIIDSSEFPKKGQHSVGVARQWCGVRGKVENCQSGVFIAYASRQGYTLVHHRLYLPLAWFDSSHQDRWQKCEIPPETRFKTKPALGLELIHEIAAADRLSFRWVLGDEAFGRDSAFLDGVAALECWYFAEVPHDTRVWLQRPKTQVPAGTGRGRRPTRVQLQAGESLPQRVDEVAVRLKPTLWQPYVIKEGSKGPIVAEFAFQRGVSVREGVPGPEVWLIFRRDLEEAAVLKVYLSNASAEIPVTELVRMAGMRWPIETAFQESKDGLGMDHYEGRTWRGWHHHLTMCLLAHHFLVRAQRQLKKKPRG